MEDETNANSCLKIDKSIEATTQNQNEVDKGLKSPLNNIHSEENIFSKSIYNNLNNNKSFSLKKDSRINSNYEFASKVGWNNPNIDEVMKYTYEGAIENYRSRIKSKINFNQFNKDQNDSTKENKTDFSLPKGDLFKRKEIFEKNKEDLSKNDPKNKVPEEIVNTQSIKERLQSLERCVDQTSINIEKTEFPIGSVKSR